MKYSGDERVERGVGIVVHKSVVRSAVQKILCNDRIIALKLKAEPVSTLINTFTAIVDLSRFNNSCLK